MISCSQESLTKYIKCQVLMKSLNKITKQYYAGFGDFAKNCEIYLIVDFFWWEWKTMKFDCFTLSVGLLAVSHP